jgi:hypothetical protein
MVSWRWTVMLVVTLVGCGYTEEEMADKQRHIEKLTADLRLANDLLAEDKATFERASMDLAKLHEEAQHLASVPLSSPAESEMDPPEPTSAAPPATGPGHRYEEHMAERRAATVTEP